MGCWDGDFLPYSGWMMWTMGFCIVIVLYSPTTNSSHLPRRAFLKGKFIFQHSVFQGCDLLVSGGVKRNGGGNFTVNGYDSQCYECSFFPQVYNHTYDKLPDM